MKRVVTGLFGVCLILGMSAGGAVADDPAATPPAYALPKQPDDVDRYYSPAFDTCLKAAHSSRDTEICSLNERDVQVRKMEEVYKRRLAHAAPAERARLEADQAAWEDASLADCHTHSRPGRWGAIAFVACARANAIARRLQLEGRPGG
jgi:uncharacterized protein YecT (DUF1311 family)